MKPTHFLHVLSIDGRYHQLLEIIHVEAGLDPNLMKWQIRWINVPVRLLDKACIRRRINPHCFRSIASRLNGQSIPKCC